MDVAAEKIVCLPVEGLSLADRQVFLEMMRLGLLRVLERRAYKQTVSVDDDGRIRLASRPDGVGSAWLSPEGFLQAVADAVEHLSSPVDDPLSPPAYPSLNIAPIPHQDILRERFLAHLAACGTSDPDERQLREGAMALGRELEHHREQEQARRMNQARTDFETWLRSNSQEIVRRSLAAAERIDTGPEERMRAVSAITVPQHAALTMMFAHPTEGNLPVRIHTPFGQNVTTISVRLRGGPENFLQCAIPRDGTIITQEMVLPGLSFRFRNAGHTNGVDVAVDPDVGDILQVHETDVREQECRVQWR